MIYKRFTSLVLLTLVLSLVIIFYLPAQASKPTAAPQTTHIVRIPTKAVSQFNTLALNPILQINYNSFLWVELNSTDLKTLQSTTIPYIPQLNPFTLNLGGQKFDPHLATPTLPVGWGTSNTNGSDLHLIQLIGPTQSKWLNTLKSNGLQIVQYIHPYTYIVWGNQATLNQATNHKFVRWAGPFVPGYRVLPQWRNLSNQRYNVRLMVYRETTINDISKQLINLGGYIQNQASTDPVFDNIHLSLPGNKFLAAAQLAGVYSLKVLPTDGGLRGEMSNQVNVNNIDGSNQAFPGYLAWLNSAGINGAGVIIANVDGGIYDTHPDLVNRMLPCTGITCGGSAVNDHGTHTAGIMAADGSSGTLDSYGFLRGLGMAPGANLVEQVYSPYYTQPGGMLLLMTDSYNNGASLSGNSWGPSGSPLGYDDDTRQVDVGVRDADPDTSGNQPLSYILSFMNGGGGNSSQGTPDEAKNIFTIGSTKMQTSGGAQILDINDISSNSAHGPALDGRTIPHMVAPGCYVDSPDSLTGYGLKCGTSMASPHVSGAVALFIEYYRNLFAIDPSPALIKAAFLPVSHDLAGYNDADGGTLGHPFDSKQGWGRMDTAAVVSPTVEIVYFDNPLIFDNTGEEWLANIKVADPSKPLKLMLVWTDAPGHGLGGDTPAWNNDLDLVVEMGGNTYYGNYFDANTGWSQNGGTPDPMNNTEGVFIGPTASGQATIRVQASNINSDAIPNQGDDTDQDFSLVCYNCLDDTDYTLNVTPRHIEVCSPTNVLYTITAQALITNTIPVTLSVQSPPPNATVDFSINPLTVTTSTVTSTLTISNLTAVTPNLYSIDVVGVSTSSTHTSTVTLALFDNVPNSPTPTSPPNGAIGVNPAPLFEWNPVSDAGSYWLEVATDAAFNTIVYSTTELNTSHQLPISLDPLTTYYWHVKAANICGEGTFSTIFNFTTLDIPPVLLVDDDGNTPDVLTEHTDTLDALGIAYDVWDTGTSDTNEPTLTDLAPYQAVIWFTGDAFGSGTGPGSSTETDLGAFLDTGRCLLMNSQDYLYAKGTTAFMQNYLGLSVGDSDVSQTIVTGNGIVFGGLGPYNLSYPFANYSDDLTPDASAELAFSGNAGIGDAAIAKDNGTYKTTWLGFPFEALPDAAAREEVMGAFFDWCDLGGSSSITLEKTVGTDPSACAITDSVMVAPGTDVTYCYQITNTGALILTQHSLLDDQLGTIFSSTYTLAPQDTIFITQTATITQDTVNVATWTAYNPGPVDVATATDIATVTIANPAISLAKTVSTDGSCGVSNQITVIGDTDISYCYNVTNIGNIALYTHTLVDDQLGIILDAQNPLLDIGQSYEVITTTLITNTTINSATWMATDDTASYQVQATNMATVTVIPASYGLELDPNSSTLTGSPGDTVIHTLTLTNTGNLPDSFDLLASDYSWVTTVVTSVGPLQVGESTTIDVSVDIDILATHGDMDTALLTATSQADSQVTDSSIVTTTATIISYTLSVNMVGNGSVSLNPTGNLHQENTVVTLTAIADTGWYFTGWRGDLSSTVATETLTMDSDKVVTATFAEIPPPTYTLSINIVGSGSVSLSPDGGIYDENTAVELVATPDTGWYFAGWSGDLSSTVTTETLTIDSDKVVTATFAQSGTISYGVVVASNNTALTATVGTTVSYTVWITNTGNTEETFTLALSAETWTSTLSSNTTGVLSANQGTTATLSVAIPSTATDGESDSVLFIASSTNASGNLSLITTAINDGSTGGIGFKVYLPIVLK